LIVQIRRASCSLVRLALGRSAVSRPNAGIGQTAIREIVGGTAVGVHIIDGGTIRAQQVDIIAGVVQVVGHLHDVIPARLQDRIRRDLPRRAARTQQIIDPHAADVQLLAGCVVKFHPFGGV